MEVGHGLLPVGTSAAATDAPDTFGAAADELFALPLGQFTARRNALAAQARAAGDRSAAEEIKGLRRPTVVGWLVNQLVRQDPGQLRELLELGEALRDATAGLQGQQLRQLGVQQRQLISALVSRAGQIAGAAGQPVGEEALRGVADTLQAALADPGAAEAIAAGRLTAGLAPAGFVGVTSLPAAAERAAPVAAASTARPLDEDSPLARAHADLASAKGEADHARATLRAAEEAARQADGEVQRTQLEVGRLREELEAATQRQGAVARSARSADADRDRAAKDERDADRRLQRAQAQLEAVQARQGTGGGGS